MTSPNARALPMVTIPNADLSMGRSLINTIESACASPIPSDAKIRVFRSRMGVHLFVVDGSRIYDIAEDTAGQVISWISSGGVESDLIESARELLPNSSHMPKIDGRPLAPPRLHSISLNVAQACNLACKYCYAEEGTFGGTSRLMSHQTARAAVDRLLEESEPGSTVVVGFMGGEPLLNRSVLHSTARYAASVAPSRNRAVQFSITTNATLIEPEDAALFAELPFTVQVSIDGDKSLHNLNRPSRDGSGSYDLMVEGIRRLRVTRPKTLSARVTVTPVSGSLLPILDHVISLGFDDVGFGWVLVSPNPSQTFTEKDFSHYLLQMIICGNRAISEWKAGRNYPFANLHTALGEIHRGTHRPYPCGAGAGYLSANAEGQLFACHRLIDDKDFVMGNVFGGTDLGARVTHLETRHVDQSEPCRSCWARYLCGGGCYHEVSRRGRIGCDFIRGWLDYCLTTYTELSSNSSDLLLATTKHLPKTY